MVDTCTLKDTAVNTRLDTAPEVELQGTLFNRDCENLDITIPRKKNQYIDNCEIPDLPEEPLKLKENVTAPISVDAPTQKIPKNLLAALLPCGLKGRTPGPDITIERELDADSNATEVDFVNALITKSVYVEDVGTFTASLDVKSEECFCDEACGTDDFIKIRINSGIKYEDTHGTADYSIPRSRVQRILDNFVVSGTAGFFAQIVSYEALDCLGENASDTDIPEESTVIGNRWQYRIRRLTYDPCATDCTKIETEATHPVADDDDVDEDNNDETPETEPLLAYNLIEYINTQHGSLGSGTRGYYPWHVSYIANPKQLDGTGYNMEEQRTQTLPVPVGTLIYVMSTEPDNCESATSTTPNQEEPEEPEQNEPEYEPVYLFAYENREASRYPIIALATTDHPIDKSDSTEVRNGITVKTDIGPATLYTVDPESGTKQRLVEMPLTDIECPARGTPISIDARNLSGISLDGNILAIMDTFGAYYGIPLPKEPPLEGTGILSGYTPYSIDRFELNGGATMAICFSDQTNNSLPLAVGITLPKTLNRYTDPFWLPAGCHVSFRSDPASVPVDYTFMGGLDFHTPITVKLPSNIILDNYHLPILEGYALCDITGVGNVAPVAYVTPSGVGVLGYTIQLKEGITFNGLHCIFAEPTVINEGNTLVAGTPVICQWDTTQGNWLITQAGCGPIADRDYSDYDQHTDSDGNVFTSREAYLLSLTQDLWNDTITI